MTSRRERPPSGRHNMSARYSALPSPLSNNSVVGSTHERPKSAFQSSQPLSTQPHQLPQQQQRPYYMPSPRKEQRPATAGGNNSHNSHRIAHSQMDLRASMPNLQTRPQSAHPQPNNAVFQSSSTQQMQPATAGSLPPRPNTSANINANPPPSSSSAQHEPNTQRTAESEISTREVLRRMREKSDLARRKQASEEIDALGDYNAFSRPRPSNTAPLRSAFLDPEINNFPKSRTRTELMKRIRYASMPHPSYDLDNDGYVSRDDYRLAKRFDFDGNGLLDPEEREIGKRVLTDEFFKRHAHDLHNFGAEFVNRTHKEVRKETKLEYFLSRFFLFVSQVIIISMDLSSFFFVLCRTCKKYIHLLTSSTHLES